VKVEGIQKYTVIA